MVLRETLTPVALFTALSVAGSLCFVSGFGMSVKEGKNKGAEQSWDKPIGRMNERTAVDKRSCFNAVHSAY